MLCLIKLEKYYNIRQKKSREEVSSWIMVRIRLSDRELKLLNLCLSNETNCDSIIFTESEIIVKNNDLNVLEIIIDLILTYFLEKGLDNNDEPNKLGMELENLNAKFIREVRNINDMIIESDKKTNKKTQKKSSSKSKKC